MVKRPKSPEPIEDTKFLAVVYPFPLNANMELIEDFTNFMYWLASVVGKDYALGVFFKPSARGMIVAEVSKTFSQFEKLLGEHRWGEFLREPSTEERDKKTKVYYSTYTNSRALQKDGWKYLLADDNLFSHFRPVNKKVKHPYPPTRWCEPHYEDPTNKQVCRPLPVVTKAPPPRISTVAQVPGSSTWTNKKSGIKGATGPSPNESKGGSAFKGDSKAGVSKNKSKVPMDPDAWKTPITTAGSTPVPPSPSNPFPKTTSWTKPLSSASFSSDLSTPRSISPASAAAGTEVDSIASSSLLTSAPYESFDDFPDSFGPPGLSPIIPKGKPTNPAGSSSITMLQQQFASSSISSGASSIAATGSQSEYLDDFDGYSDEEDRFEFPTADMISVSEEVSYDPVSGPRMGKGAGKGRRGQGNVVADFPFTSSRNPKDNSQSKVVQQFSSRTFRKIVEEEPCPVHGVICSKGICSVMKKKKWEKEREEKKKESEERRERRKRVREGKTQPELDEKGNVVDDSEAQQDESQADGDTEVEDPAESIVKSAPSVAGSMSSTTEGKQSEGGGKGRKGDWGPRKTRNAKQKSYLLDKRSETPTPSKASSTADDGSLYGTYAPSSHRSIPVSESATKMRRAATSPSPTIKSPSIPPSSVWRTASTSPFSSRGATVSQGSSGNAPVMVRKGGNAPTDTTSSIGSAIGVNPEKGKRKESWRRPFEPVVPEIKVRPNEQAKKMKPKTWDEMVEEGDGSELGSIMDFGGR